MLIIAALGLFHAVTVPAFWPVDETAHVAYADAVVSGELPNINDPIPVNPDLPGLTERLDWERRERHQGRLDIWTANHPPLPALIQGLALRAGTAVAGGGAGLVAARLTSVVWGMIAVVMTFMLAQLLVPRRPRVAITASVIVAITPTLAHLSGLAFNDAAGLATGTACLVAGTTIAVKGFTLRRGTLLVLCASAATLTRVSTLPAVALAIGLAVYGIWRRHAGSGEPEPVVSRLWRRPRRSEVGLAVLTGILAAPPMAFYLRNLLLYGDISASGALLAKFARDPNTPVGELLVNRWFWLRLWNRLWGDLTTGHWNIGARATLTEAFMLLILVGLVFLLATAIRRGMHLRVLTSPLGISWLAGLAVLAAALVTTISFHSTGGSLHGRYLLPAHAVTAIIIACALHALPDWLGRQAVWLAVVPLVIVNASLLWMLVVDAGATWARPGVSLNLPVPLDRATGVLQVLAILLLAAGLAALARCTRATSPVGTITADRAGEPVVVLNPPAAAEVPAPVEDAPVGDTPVRPERVRAGSR